jgi:hypothetical protein
MLKEDLLRMNGTDLDPVGDHNTYNMGTSGG